MSGIREKKREELREKLIEAATSIIKSDTLKGLRARDIAQKAGCALGSVYTIYDDLDHLILDVNTITLRAMGEFLDRYAEQADAPDEKLLALARGYLTFASEHYNIWHALFAHTMDNGFPDWFLEEYQVLLARISGPMRQIFSDLDEHTLWLRTKTFYSAVHGIVSISMQEVFVAVPKEELEIQLTSFVESALRGYTDQ